LSTGSIKKFTLSSEERLKSRKKIQELFAAGKAINFSPFKIIFRIDIDPSPLQFGVAVGTRQFKKAVNRNRIKRLIRESYRLQKNELKDLLIKKEKSLAIFVIYTGKSIPHYPFVFEKIGKVLKKISEEIHAQG
jgi:ribonuclease P protein component